MRFRTSIFAAIVGTLLLAVNVAAQVSRGSISGTVTDPSGAVLAGAQVKATNVATGTAFNQTTDNSGLFRIQQLPVGTYNVQITRSGFRTTMQSGVNVSAGADTGIGAVQLQVGEAAGQVVEVTGTTPLIETTEAQVTNSFTGQQLSTFAGVAENQGLDNLALFIPGVVNSRDNNFSNYNGVGFSVNGLRGRNNDQEVDGQQNNDNSVAGPALFLSDPEMVQEYQIVTNNFGPQYGRNSGSVVNIITMSGTNNWHGAAWGTEYNSALNTRTHLQKDPGFENLKKVPQFNEQFSGGKIGGPILKNRLFFFTLLDDDLLGQTQVISQGGLTPSPAGLATLATCFSGNQNLAVLNKYGPFAIKGGNPTPQGTKVQDLSGCPGVEFATGVNRTLPGDSRNWDWDARGDLDYDRDRFTMRYFYQRTTPLNIDEGNGAAGYPANVPGRGHLVALSWSHNLSNLMTNEARVNFSRVDFEFGGNTLGTVPLATNIGSALANINFSSSKFMGFGPPTNMPQGRIVNSYQFQDNWNYVRGQHQFKAGANITYQKSPNFFLPNYNGSFQFPSWDAFFANSPTTVSIVLGNPELGFKETDSFFYFGDDWKIRRDLTLNLGLTWSYYGQPANLFHERDVKRESGSSPFFNPSLPLSIRTFPSIPAPKNSWGPSVGFAYSPQWGGWLTGNGKFVLRGGYRLAYDPPFYNIYTNIATSAPQVLSQTISSLTTSPMPGLPADPTGPNVRSSLASFLTLGVFDPRRFNQTTVSPNFGPDRAHEWSLGVQREFGTHIAAEARYVGNHGEHLFQSINANPRIDLLAADFPQFVPSGLTPCPAANAVVPSARGRIDCNRGVVRERTNTGYSDYNGIQTELRATNLFHQLTLRSGYTYSKTTDNVSEIFGTFVGGNTIAFAQNPLDYTNAEHSLSALDIPHTFTIGFQEELPFMRKQEGVLGKIAGGWFLSGSYIIASGQTYTPIQFFINGSGYNDYTFLRAFSSGVEDLRPYWGNPAAPADQVGIYAGDLCNYDGAAGCSMASNTMLSWNQYNSQGGAANTINANQVRYIVNGPTANQIYGTPFGNVRRNIARDAKTNYGNASLYKNIKLTERMNLQAHVTVQNIFNHPNYQSIDPFLDDAGVPVSTDTGFALPWVTNDSTLGSSSRGRRQLVGGLRFSF
jgi:hypothetical protein